MKDLDVSINSFILCLHVCIMFFLQDPCFTKLECCKLWVIKVQMRHSSAATYRSMPPGKVDESAAQHVKQNLLVEDLSPARYRTEGEDVLPSHTQARKLQLVDWIHLDVFCRFLFHVFFNVSKVFVLFVGHASLFSHFELFLTRQIPRPPSTQSARSAGFFGRFRRSH